MFKQNFTITYNTKISITSDDIDNIMSTALNGSIIRWCSKICPVGERKAGCLCDEISRDGTLSFHTDEDSYLLNRKTLLAGIEAWLQNAPADSVRLIIGSKTLRGNMIDENDADRIIQYALFGEIRFPNDSQEEQGDSNGGRYDPFLLRHGRRSERL